MRCQSQSRSTTTARSAFTSISGWRSVKRWTKPGRASSAGKVIHKGSSMNSSAMKKPKAHGQTCAFGEREAKTQAWLASDRRVQLAIRRHEAGGVFGGRFAHGISDLVLQFVAQAAHEFDPARGDADEHLAAIIHGMGALHV